MIALLARKARAAVDVARAALAVSRARRLIARRPIGTLVETSAALVQEPDQHVLPEADRQRGARWGVAVDRALRWLPGDSACLVRASALRELVVTRGLPRATVRIGVRRLAAGFEAHAWVEQDGLSIAEPPALQGAFETFDGVTIRSDGRP